MKRLVNKIFFKKIPIISFQIFISFAKYDVFSILGKKKFMVQLPIMFLSYSCKIVYSFASISIFSITTKNLESKDNVNDVVR